MQALPFSEGCDTLPPKENSDSVSKVGTAPLQFSSLCQEQSWVHGPGLGEVLGQVRLQSFLIRNRN